MAPLSEDRASLQIREIIETLVPGFCIHYILRVPSPLHRIVIDLLC